MSANFKSVVSALCNCFVPKSGGGVSEQLVYGKRTSELGIADIETPYIAVTANIKGFNFTAPSDGRLHVASDNPEYLGVMDNDANNFLWLLRPKQFNSAFCVYLKKGQTVYVSHQNDLSASANITAKFKPI